jgi:hypothetical protein
LGAADVLIPALARGDGWLSSELLHDGTVVAALRLGEPGRAHAAAKAVEPHLRRGRVDVRTLLVSGLLAESADRPRTAAR